VIFRVLRHRGQDRRGRTGTVHRQRGRTCPFRRHRGRPDGRPLDLAALPGRGHKHATKEGISYGQLDWRRQKRWSSRHTIPIFACHGSSPGGHSAVTAAPVGTSLREPMATTACADQAAQSLRISPRSGVAMYGRYPSRRSTPTPPTPLHQLTDCSPSEADRVLLGCFGLDLSGTRSQRDLCRALRYAGYSSTHARHVVRLSPLVVEVRPAQARAHCYRLRRCTE
jgi:hypothetical protein